MICMESGEVKGLAMDGGECFFEVPLQLFNFSVDNRVSHLYPSFSFVESVQMVFRLNEVDIFW